MEAVIQTAVPRNTDKKVLVLANGAYGKRINKICETMGVPFDNLTGSEREPISKAGIISLNHDSSIFRQSPNPVCGFSMMAQVRLFAVWPT